MQVPNPSSSTFPHALLLGATAICDQTPLFSSIIPVNTAVGAGFQPVRGNAVF